MSNINPGTFTTRPEIDGTFGAAFASAGYDLDISSLTPSSSFFATAGCVARLRRLVAGPDRSWIGRPEQPASFADGTRLFAYRALRTKLGCRDLALALADVRASTRLLQSASGIAPERVQKANALAADIAAELGSEHNLRCKAMGQAATANR